MGKEFILWIFLYLYIFNFTLINGSFGARNDTDAQNGSSDTRNDTDAQNGSFDARNDSDATNEIFDPRNDTDDQIRNLNARNERDAQNESFDARYQINSENGSFDGRNDTVALIGSFAARNLSDAPNGIFDARNDTDVQNESLNTRNERDAQNESFRARYERDVQNGIFDARNDTDAQNESFDARNDSDVPNEIFDARNYTDVQNGSLNARSERYAQNDTFDARYETDFKNGSFDARNDTEAQKGNNSLVIHTTHGLVEGLLTKLPSGKDVFSFLGIPYAKPPLGKLRFSHPVPAVPWSDVFKAAETPNSCVQQPAPGSSELRQLEPFKITNNMSEDCLKINIWVPSPKPSNAAIMMWIHGGVFQLGSCSLSLYNGQYLSSEEEVIVVCINYRLSTLGFLFLDHSDVPGNAGLYDQLLAIKWMKENAEAFGGDSSRITVFGESAGAGATGYLLLSPLNSNLFSRAILQSGSPTSLWASTNRSQVLNLSFELISKVGCSKENRSMNEVIQCLRLTDPLTLVESQPNLDEKYIDNLSPFPDGEIIPSFIKATLESINQNNFSVLFGNTANDGSFMLIFGALNYSALQHNEITVKRQIFEKQLRDISPYKQDLVLEIARFLYTNWSHPSDNFYTSLEDLTTDIIFTCESERVTQQLTKSGSKVFSYVFDHRSSVKAWPDWMGVPHLDDVEFVFGDPMDPNKKYTKREKQLSKRVMRMWANFARTGDPRNNEDGSKIAPDWRPYSIQSREYIVIGTDDDKPREGQRAKYCHFWNSIAPRILDKCGKSG